MERSLGRRNELWLPQGLSSCPGQCQCSWQRRGCCLPGPSSSSCCCSARARSPLPVPQTPSTPS
eukprot:3298448-Rhodomonas_salina.2